MRTRLSVVLFALAALSACGPGGPASMEFVEISPLQPKIGDVVTVRFKLTDSRGVALAGQAVDFKLEGNKPGVTLSPTTATSIKGSGFAETQIVATARVTSVIVVATAGDKQVLSPAISFAGSVPNGRQFTFQCGHVAGSASGGAHAIGAYDPARNLIAGVKLECSAHVGDRNGDGVAGALVSFLTEAGTIGPTETTETSVVGDATVLYKTSYPLPAETTPGTFKWTPPDGSQTGQLIAPLWMEPWNWYARVFDPTNRGAALQEPRRIDPVRKNGADAIQLNPRDNLVTLIAVSAGEEGFSDDNNNGKWDPASGGNPAEAFDDLAEPFVDSNDNGVWDPGERYIDVNGDGKWNPPNGQWDANTLLWTSERILWTGFPLGEDTQGADAILRDIGNAGHSIAMTCPGTPCLQAGPVAHVSIFVSDPWVNTIAQNSDGDGCTIAAKGDKSLIVTTPSVANKGQKVLYPAGDIISLTIQDSRDPTASPADQRPRAVPPSAFEQPVICAYTSSMIEGETLLLTISTVTGTIE